MTLNVAKTPNNYTFAIRIEKLQSGYIVNMEISIFPSLSCHLT